MGKSQPFDFGSPSGAPEVSAGEFVDGGEIKIAKLVGTLLGATWMTVIAGWITVIQAVNRVNLEILYAIAGMFDAIITTFGQEGARTLRESWGAAYRSAVAVDPVVAPLIMTVEVVLVTGLLVWARRRFTE